METILVKIKTYIDGDTAISYKDGKKCQKDISEHLDHGAKVILDFTGVDYVIIGDLILERGSDVMQYIGIKNANDSIIQKIKLVKDGALMKREDLDE